MPKWVTSLLKRENKIKYNSTSQIEMLIKLKA